MSHHGIATDPWPTHSAQPHVALSRKWPDLPIPIYAHVLTHSTPGKFHSVGSRRWPDRCRCWELQDVSRPRIVRGQTPENVRLTGGTEADWRILGSGKTGARLDEVRRRPGCGWLIVFPIMW